MTKEELLEFDKYNRSLTPLNCDICHAHICWVDEFDLEGSYFFCDACMSGIVCAVDNPQKIIPPNMQAMADEIDKLAKEFAWKHVRHDFTVASEIRLICDLCGEHKIRHPWEPYPKPIVLL